MEEFIHPLDDVIRLYLLDYAALYKKTLTYSIGLLNKMLVSKYKTEEYASLMLLYRNYLDLLDSSIPLIINSSKQTLEIIFRCMLELSANIKYILEENITSRCLAYQVTYSVNKINQYKKIDKNKMEGKEFIAIVNKDELIQGINLPEVNSDESSKYLLAMLQKEPFLSVHNEYKKTRKNNGNKKIEWFSLWNGPKNVNELFGHLKMNALYEVMYRVWSNSIHQTGAFTQVTTINGNGAVTYLRDPSNINSILQLGMSITLDLNNRIFDKIIGGVSPRENALWYVNDLKPSYDKLQRIKII